jgi:hypothetical protein
MTERRKQTLKGFLKWIPAIALGFTAIGLLVTLNNSVIKMGVELDNFKEVVKELVAMHPRGN